MKANQGANLLIDQPADYGRLRSVLHDWGYTETEIQRFLNENASALNISSRDNTRPN